jgi:hypothetical protein
MEGWRHTHFLELVFCLWDIQADSGVVGPHRNLPGTPIQQIVVTSKSKSEIYGNVFDSDWQVVDIWDLMDGIPMHNVGA